MGKWLQFEIRSLSSGGFYSHSSYSHPPTLMLANLWPLDPILRQPSEHQGKLEYFIYLFILAKIEFESDIWRRKYCHSRMTPIWRKSVWFCNQFCFISFFHKLKIQLQERDKNTTTSWKPTQPERNCFATTLGSITYIYYELCMHSIKHNTCVWTW